MDSQLKRGLLDACVLAILAQGESYGYKIIQSAQSVMAIRESTLYPILRRMEQQGFLSTYHQEFNGRLRKYYRITAEGKQRLENFRSEWKDVKQMVDYIMGGELSDT